MILISSTAAAAFFSFTTLPDVLRVPEDYPTIQTAIDAAGDGDTVDVGPGTYLECLAFLGKAITVEGRESPETTIVDGNGSGCVVRFSSGEGPGSILRGLTIRNGTGTRLDDGSDALAGAGILCVGTSPTILGNHIVDNVMDNDTWSYGAGLYSCDGSPRIEGNRFEGNDHQEHGLCGGGLYLESGEPIVRDNVIAGNHASTGAGLYCLDCAATIETNHIIGNTVGGGGTGAGIVIHGAPGPLVRSNRIERNVARAFIFLPEGSGGGIECCGTAITLTTSGTERMVALLFIGTDSDVELLPPYGTLLVAAPYAFFPLAIVPDVTTYSLPGGFPTPSTFRLQELGLRLRSRVGSFSNAVWLSIE